MIEEELTPLQVDDYLNQVTYGEDSSYVATDFAFEFIHFIKLVNGAEGEEHKSPVVHYKMLDKIVSDNPNIINMCSRGLAKTTVLGEYLFLYIAVYGALPGLGKITSAIFVGDSIDNGVKNMRKNLEFRWRNSEFLQHYIPKIKFVEVTWEFINIDGKTFTVTGYGAKSGVRGKKTEGKRPNLAILDDILSDDDARSETVISSIEDTVDKAVEYALDIKFKIIWSGTPFNARDPLYKAVNSGAWEVNVFPVCEEFPCTKAEFKGAWPDRFTYEFVLGKYTKALKQGKVSAFNQELMLRIMSDKERLIRDEDIRWYSLTTLLKNRGNFNYYITTDFATSAKESSDYSVISVWAYSNNGQWFWVDGICKKQSMGVNIKDLFKLVQKWKPQSVGVEVSGQQGGFIPWIQEQMLLKNNMFTLASDPNSNTLGLRPTVDKFKRFSVVEPWFKLGLIHFPIELKDSVPITEAVNELSLISLKGFKSKHDDFCDTISMLSVMQAWKPNQDDIMQTDSEDLTSVWEPEELEDINNQLDSYIV